MSAVYTFEYDRAYAGPAFPAVEVKMSDIAGTDPEIEVAAWIDSGADATSVPLRMLKQIKARQVDTRYAMGTSGVKYPVDMYEIALTLGKFNWTRIVVVGDRQGDKILIGRDVLNDLIVTLNGLAYIVTISDLP